jgi:hypothetical protein
MPVYILHLWELDAPCEEWVEIVAAGAATVLNALPPRRRAALFGRALPFRVILVDEDCRPVLVIPPDLVAIFASCHGRPGDARVREEPD